MATLLPIHAASAQRANNHPWHVVFENSSSDRAYYHSQGSVVSPSEFKITDGKLPVEFNRFISPPNSLRLQWNSVSDGDWRATLKVATRYGRKFDFTGDVISLWCYSVEGLDARSAPRVSLRNSSGHGLWGIELLQNGKQLPAGKWVRVNLPLPRLRGLYGGTSDNRFDLRRLASIDFVQGIDDRQSHTLYIDDVRVLDSKASVAASLHLPARLVAEAFHRHIELQWLSDPSDDLCSYRIYRSVDGENYRTGLVWEKFMANPEIPPMLEAIGFVADEDPPR